MTDWGAKAENRAARQTRWLETQPVPVIEPAPPLDPFPHLCPGDGCAVCRWVAARG